MTSNNEKSGQQFLDILHAFNSITERITEYNEDIGQLLQAILSLIVSMPDVSYASIMLIGDKKDRFNIIAASGEAPFKSDLACFLDASKLTRLSASKDQKVELAELFNESKLNELDQAEQKTFKDVICSPLMVQQNIVGVTCVYGKASGLDILESEEFSIWSKLARLAIEKSRMYNELNERLEITNEELKRRESQLIRSEKLRSLVEIAMSVAHAIRNPVTVIGGLSRRIYKNMPENDPIRLKFEMIISEASRLEGIVKEFERFFSINRMNLERTDLNLLIEEAADEFLLKCQITPDLILERSLSKVPLICNVDRNLFKRCIMHLLINAKEASMDGLRITLTSSRTDSNAIIDIVDSGKGMFRHEMDHVFDPFYSTKGEGVGMGLTFVHFVITEHSGQVELTSKKGKGTRFRIWFPLEK